MLSSTVQEAATGAGRPVLLVLVRHAESERNVAKKGNRFFLDDEARKSVQGIPDHRTPLTDRGRLFRDRGGQRVLVVTHGGTLWMLRMLLERWTWEETEDRFRTGSVPQCSVTDYVFDPNSGRLVLHELTRVYWDPPPSG